MFHARHAAQHGQHAWETAGEAEGPGSHAPFGLALLQTGHDAVGHVRQTSAQQGFHDDGRDIPLGQFVVQVFSVRIARVDLFGILPVQVVQLNLYEVPFIIVVARQQVVEHPDVTVVRETQVADASCPALFQQKLQNAVVHIARLKLFHAVVAHAYAVQQQVVDIVCLQLLQRVLVHGDGALPCPSAGREIGQLGGDEILVARMPAQGNARGTFRAASTISG